MRIQMGGVVAIACLAAACAAAPSRHLDVTVPQLHDPYFQAAAQRIGALPASRRARNVIIFIGDGMGVATVTAARIYAGQSAGVDGESYSLIMDTFPHTALSRTYAHDTQISDSAPTATALVSGVKTVDGVVGVTSEATRSHCEGQGAHNSRSLFEIAEAEGLATGVVSTARITHATPAAAYAHAASRGWESDAELSAAAAAGCIDIARQLIEWPEGDGLELALGGGRWNFLPAGTPDTEYPDDPRSNGRRLDGRDLIAEWRARSPDHAYAANTSQLMSTAPDAHVLGLFSADHMAYESRRGADRGGEPSLAEMTAFAIQRLSRDSDGFALMVEGGRIDHAHHEGRAGLALSETVAFDAAIHRALEMTSRDDTLIIVTADHSHTLSIAGYAARGTPILGLSTGDDGRPALAADGRPYTTLSYANGPGSVFILPASGAAQPVLRPDLSAVDTSALDYVAQSLVPFRADRGGQTHGGEDVVIYGWGPGDDAVAGTLEENAVFHIMARALGFSWR